LIVNADDFGWSSGVNRAVAQLHDSGILTSASLMVTGPAADEAVALAKERPGLAVGLHLALVLAPPALPPAQLPRLVGKSGSLPDAYHAAALRYTLLPGWRQEMEAEAQAQFARFATIGLPWSHVDAHLHLSLSPAVFAIARKLAQQYRVPGFRVPQDEPLPGEHLSLRAWMEAWALRRIGSWQRHQLRRIELVTTDRCYGYFHSGRLTETYLTQLVEALPDGDFELHCHPDLDTEAGREETAALESASFREALARRRVQLCTYAELAETTKPGG
jgi:hopanoid biosynthesis associated protein HpnK